MEKAYFKLPVQSVITFICVEPIDSVLVGFHWVVACDNIS